MKTLINSLFICLGLSLYVYPSYAQTTREVIIVSEKKHVLSEHVVGLDTYDHPVNYDIKEQYILRFKNRSGYFTVDKEVYDSTKIGDKFTTEDNNLFYCRRQDGCYDLY